MIIEYTADIVLTNEEIMQGFDRMCDWADKKKKEGKNNEKQSKINRVNVYIIKKL